MNILEESVLVENQLENQFSQLRVIDASEPDSEPKKIPIFNRNQLQQAMRTKRDDDDD